ncbi:restriction endonuclease subunit S [Limosilactobacillus reuteri]|uniref:restriction endonuclease subunit S n=1 Tax=Limosilactobacillus reuteri TaxID=1598 RepID=UPI002987FEF6|nr:restriction endonuclease subunit S [Limosilactobacillus reuteri]
MIFIKVRINVKWEQHKLGKIMNVTSVKRIHQSDWQKVGIPFYRARDVVAISKGQKISEPIYISENKYKEFSEISGKVKINDLLVTGVGTIGVPLLVQKTPLYFKDGNIIWFQNNNQFNGIFLYNAFLTRSIQNFIKTTTGVGTVPTYTIITGKETPISFPKPKEQDRIATLLKTAENLITLQQRKLEQLKQLKKAILQIIASNRLLLHTKKVDMIKVRVADIYKITRGNVLSRSEISNVRTSKYPYPVYSSQTKNHGLMGYYKNFLFKNAITWTTDGANAGTVKYRKGRFYSTNVNGVLLSSEGLANQLTAELLNLVAFKYVSHVGNPKLMNNTMGEIIFNIPKSVETQQYFSGCIESVIDLIGKQEKATDKLNKLKKYLLQKLFI